MTHDLPYKFWHRNMRIRCIHQSGGRYGFVSTMRQFTPLYSIKTIAEIRFFGDSIRIYLVGDEAAYTYVPQDFEPYFEDWK